MDRDENFEQYLIRMFNQVIERLESIERRLPNSPDRGQQMMTPEEHRLIIEMFKQQTLFYAGLVEILQSRGVIDHGDLEAFDDVVSHTKRELLERHVEEDYVRFGTTLGVTGLPEF